ncbi:hypothetical protein L3Q82_004216 [Scortum barcoo]|uniref:Uncharacterized protein n=1 Tax=Scortum barcoo TaxID=214431 RepID=A0ACB8VMN2_9TELE|nr:hypothetical protein L3Q82_004216 [Scortum barcoo]
MSRVVFGVSPSPFLLAATIRKHIKQYETEQPKTVEALRECLYVDDFIASISDVDEALSVTTKAKEILSHAGMNLCKWITNSPELRAKWTERGMEHTTETATCGNVLKVLGLVWRSEKDDFVFDLKGLLDFMKGKENTEMYYRHQLVSLDPIGFLTPFTIRAKCLFQELWERGVGWDDQLPSDLAEKWDRWCAELPQLQQLDIPRWYQIDIKPDSQTVKLHVFCDASERAYSAVAYLQGENKEKEIVTSFVASKSKVATLKKTTLPHLELMGALIGARLGNNLLKPLNMEINQLNMWTDSVIVLHWIRSTAQRWKPFVASRVAEIQGLTNPELWSHCNGKNNPADLPTRGQSVENLVQSQLWWSGPISLSSAEEVESIDEDCIADEVTNVSREDMGKRWRQKLKRDGPVTRTIQQWSDQSDSALRDCFSTTEQWCVFVFKDTDINTYTDAVIGYIGKCIDDIVPRITVQTFPNQKPWVNGEVCAKLKAWTDTYNSGDLEEYRKSRYALRRAISSAKRQYRDKVESHYKGFQHQEHVGWIKNSDGLQKEDQQQC